MKYWKINNMSRIEALVDYEPWGLKKGDIGGFVNHCTRLPRDEYPLWIDKSVEIGSNVTIGNYTKISKYVVLGDYVTIGKSVTLDSWVILKDCVELADNVKLSNDVKLDDYVTLGDNVTLDSYVTLGYGVKLGNSVTLKKYNYIELSNQGSKKHSNILFHLNKNEVYVSVKDFASLKYDTFIGMINNNGIGISGEEDDLYRENTPVYEAIKQVLLSRVSK